MSALHVVMVTNNALEDKVGGQERYVSELASALVARGHEATIVAKRWSTAQPALERRRDGVFLQRYAVPAKTHPLYAPLFPAAVVRGVLGRVRRRHHAVIHAHLALHAAPLAAAGLPYLLTFHAPLWRELLSERQGSYRLPAALQPATVGLLRRIEGLAAGRAAPPVVLSDFMRGELRRLSPSAAQRAALIPGGIDATRFHPDPQPADFDDIADVADPGDPPAGPADPAARAAPTLFTARRLTPRTGVDALIHALALIRREVPGTRLVIAGSGPQRPALEQLAAGLGLVPGPGAAVQFLGTIGDAELARRYRAATLVVLPTKEMEGFGLSTAEALACGAAVVGTPAGATPELLAPLDPGLLAYDASAQAIARAVIALLADPARLAADRARASRRILPAMGWDAVTDRYLELYEEAEALR